MDVGCNPKKIDSPILSKDKEGRRMKFERGKEKEVKEAVCGTITHWLFVYGY